MTTAAKKIATPLFHATAETFDQPRPGNDLALWTTESSAIAQTYLPTAQGTIQTRHIFPSEMQTPVAPNRADPLYAIVLQMGFEAIDVTHDRNGVATHWKQPKKYPTYGDVVKHIEGELGYQSPHPTIKSFLLNTTGWDGRHHQHVVVPANYRTPGHLWIISGHEKMRLFDLTDPNARVPENLPAGMPLFAKLETLGYDGIIVTDHCQSSTRGPVEHRSIGFFAKAAEKLSCKSIPAVHFDWQKGDPPGLIDSPEFSGWQRAAAAIASARRAPIVHYDPDDLVIAARRIRDGRDTVPKGTRGTILETADASYLVQFAGDVMMACSADDLQLRAKNAKLSMLDESETEHSGSHMRLARA